MILRILTIFILILSCKNPEEKKKNKDFNSGKYANSCVKTVLEKDSVLGKIRNLASQNMSLSKTITNYTNELKSLNYTNCPKKFKSSFYKHIDAWLDIRKVTDKYPAMRGELHDIFENLEKSEDSTEFKLLVKHVWDTWDLVEENSP